MAVSSLYIMCLLLGMSIQLEFDGRTHLAFYIQSVKLENYSPIRNRAKMRGFFYLFFSCHVVHPFIRTIPPYFLFLFHLKNISLCKKLYDSLQLPQTKKKKQIQIFYINKYYLRINYTNITAMLRAKIYSKLILGSKYIQIDFLYK